MQCCRAKALLQGDAETGELAGACLDYVAMIGDWNVAAIGCF
jgi:hypothetical protein